MEDYPMTLAELESRFATDAACREYLASLRWQDGFVCPKCGKRQVWIMSNGHFLCSSCRRQQSVIQGTIFQDSHLPLITWFRAMWYICVQKNGASALGLQRALGLGSYRTAWMCLHKLRKAMIRPGRERLSGEVEVDETYVGGYHEGKRGRGAAGKTIVVVAAERDGRGIGRIRLLCVSGVGANDLTPAVEALVEPGSKVITDGWQGYNKLSKKGYIRIIGNDDESILANNMLPRCHRAASLLKRWILGTLQGSVSTHHLQYFLNEFTFRFNRRKSASRGKLFYRLAQHAVITEPSTYKDIVGTQPIGGG